MPTLRAMVSVDVPWSPFSANASMAACRIASRRSTAVRAGRDGLLRCSCRRMLVMTHNHVNRTNDVGPYAADPRVIRRLEDGINDHR